MLELQAISELLLERPFLGHIAAQLPLRRHEGHADIVLEFDLQGRAFLAVGRALQALWPLEVQVALLEHELWHFALGHPLLRAQAPVLWRFDLAADLLVNELLVRRCAAAPLLRVPDAVAARLPKGTTDVWRWYEALAQGEAARWAREQLDAAALFLRKHHTWVRADVPAAVQRRHCLEVVWQAGGADAERMRRLLGEAAAGSPLPEAPPPAGPDWRKVLALFARRSSRTKLKETLHRPSKRYGRVPGLKVWRRYHLAVALDTSGSVAPGELAAFGRELQRLWRAGADITVLECDCRVRRVWRYRGQPLRAVLGRGGTDFQPAIDWALRSRAAGLVYFTDGFGSVPRRVGRLPLLWVISSGGLAEGAGTWAALPGRKIKLKASS